MRRIIIVGATSGMGKCMAEKYAAEGNSVGITGRRDELLDELTSQYPNMHKACFDITSPNALDHLQILTTALGGLDLLIISAGGGESNETLDWHKEEYMVQLNVNAFVKIAHWAFLYFIRQGHGQLAAISSVAANRGNAISPAYSAAKAFQTIYMEGLALKAYKSGHPVVVSTMEPGFVDTKIRDQKVFWEIPVHKAADQMMKAIEQKKIKTYISRRWKMVAWLMRRIPYNMYRRI